MKYPNEFLGRCVICLDNAYLSASPCKPRIGVNGAPLFADECPIYRAREQYDKERRSDGQSQSKENTK